MKVKTTILTPSREKWRERSTPIKNWRGREFGARIAVIVQWPSTIDELTWVLAGEVLPRPLDDGFHAGASDSEEQGMNCEPCGEREGANELEVFTAEFGDRGVAADHRDDATIGIDEGLCR